MSTIIYHRVIMKQNGMRLNLKAESTSINSKQEITVRLGVWLW